ncbi:MAG: DoxX family protein [Rhodospirillaceae bacterium]
MTAQSSYQSAAAPAASENSLIAKLKTIISFFHARFALLPESVIGLSARIGIAMVFWNSGMTKIISTPAFTLFGREVSMPATFPPTISDVTYMLFEMEYALPVLPVPLAAWMATMAEIILPLLLIIGLATRFSALALLIMTAVIQFLVYPNLWNDHLLWAAALFYLLAKGPGIVSVDHLLGKKFKG